MQQELQGQKVYASNILSCSSSRVYLDNYKKFILDHGAQSVDRAEDADIILLDTCAATKPLEDSSVNLIQEKKSQANKQAKVIVCGCLVSINPQRLKENFSGPAFGPRDQQQLALILGLDPTENHFFSPLDPKGSFMSLENFQNMPFRLRTFMRLVYLLHRIDHHLPLSKIPWLGKRLRLSQAVNPHCYGISIAQGCMGSCSFCVIPMAKGSTQSTALGAVIAEIRKHFHGKKKVRRFILTGEDTGSYGRDIQSSIITLLDQVCAMPEEFELYINFFDPRWFNIYGEELVRSLTHPKIQYLQFPLQSGSDSVLARMRRAYKIEQLIPYFHEIKRRAPKLALSTHIIAGFPGETEEEFEQTKDFLRQKIFDHVWVFSFSERPGAQTEKMPGHLPRSLVHQRARILRRVCGDYFGLAGDMN